MASLEFDAFFAEGVGERRAGELIKDSGSFGFLRQDGFEENMFIMPKTCQAFGGVLPPLGTRLTYSVVTDEKTGRDRAEDVQPEQADFPGTPGAGFAGLGGFVGAGAGAGPDAGANEEGELLAGTIIKDAGNFGFLQQDVGGENMFVLPATCEAWGGLLPPVGTRVLYTVTIDAKTGRPRTAGVFPESEEIEMAQAFGGGAGSFGEAMSTGVVVKTSPSYGFIQQDAGGENMFVIPSSCQAFGGVLPDVGARVAYTVVTDEKTGRPRAEDVQLFGPPQPSRPVPSTAWRPGTPQAVAAYSGAPQFSGWGKGGGKGGDKGGDKGFSKGCGKGCGKASGKACGKGGCGGGGIFGGGGGGGILGGSGGACTGTLISVNGAFGFIEQDSGGDNMFVIPSSCVAFGNQFPAPGTRLKYTIVTDAKTGRPRAEDVRPEVDRAESSGVDQSLMAHGTLIKSSPQFGFIQQDAGGDNMFVIPSTCEAWGRNIPEVGTRVVYTITTDEKTGRPRADLIEPESGVAGGGGGGGGGCFGCKGKGGGGGGGVPWGGKACGKGGPCKGGGYGMGKAVRSHPYAALPY